MSETPERKEAIANGSRRRKGLFRTMMDVILPNFQDIKSNFMTEVIIPNTLDWLYDVGASFLNDMFKGSGGSGKGSTLPKAYKNTAYSSFFKGSNKNRRDRYDDTDETVVASYEDINFRTRSEAEKILATLRMDLQQYPVVTVMDLCDYSGVGSSWADNAYGWTDLSKARVIRGRDGKFYFDLPKPMPIDND